MPFGAQCLSGDPGPTCIRSRLDLTQLSQGPPLLPIIILILVRRLPHAASSMPIGPDRATLNALQRPSFLMGDCDSKHSDADADADADENLVACSCNWTYQKNQWLMKNKLSTCSDGCGNCLGPPWYGGQQPWVQHSRGNEQMWPPSQKRAVTCKLDKSETCKWARERERDGDREGGNEGRAKCLSAAISFVSGQKIAWRVCYAAGQCLFIEPEAEPKLRR